MTSEPESVLSNVEIFSVTVGKHLKKTDLLYFARSLEFTVSMTGQDV